MRAIVSVLGQDQPGIIARVSTALYTCNANILDISQTVLRDEIFVMTMLIDLANLNTSFNNLKEQLHTVSTEIGMEVKLQREELFKKMHRI